MARATRSHEPDPDYSRRSSFFALTTALIGLLILTAHVPVTADAGAWAAPMSPLVFQGMDAAACQNPANPIVRENCLPGTNEWQVRQYDPDFHVYASRDSLNVGESLDFFVNTTAGAFDLYIYRNGYYGGLGGRLVHSQSGIRGTRQPVCVRYEETGLRTCSNWTPSVTLPIPGDWVSGVYIVRVVRPDTGGENDTVFVVRQDERDSDVLYQQSVTTFQAYNNFAGKSAYSFNSSICPTVSDAPRAVEVSLNRPYNQTQFDPNHYYRVEYPMVRWLEQQGYDVTYSTNLDTHRSGKPGAHNELLDHRAFLSVGHDEYWSQEMRDAITAARDAGVHLGVFSGNTAYWRVRFLPDPVTGEPDSVMVSYKTTESGPPDPSGIHTGTWRDPAGVNDPENRLLGIRYIGDNDLFFFPLRVTAEVARDRVYRHTGLQALPADTYVEIGDQVVGWEWDALVEDDPLSPDLDVLAETPVVGMLLTDVGNDQLSNVAVARTHFIRYVAPGGAVVYNAGTIQWSWGLGARGRDAVEPDPYISQITVNILADMGLQPASPAATLILDGTDRPVPPVPAARIRRMDDIRPAQIRDLGASVSGTTVTLSWETDVETVGQIWTGPGPANVYIEHASDRELYTRDHNQTLRELEPDQTYFYRVVAVDRDWNLTLSEPLSFQTQGISLPNQLVSIVKPAILTAGCWVRDRTIGVDVFGMVSVGSILFAMWIIFVGRVVPRRRPRIRRVAAG